MRDSKKYWEIQNQSETGDEKIVKLIYCEVQKSLKY